MFLFSKKENTERVRLVTKIQTSHDFLLLMSARVLQVVERVAAVEKFPHLIATDCWSVTMAKVFSRRQINFSLSSNSFSKRARSIRSVTRV